MGMEKLLNAIKMKGFLEGDIEYEMAYIKQIEQEFASGVDDLLKVFELHHLRVFP
jgi:hypothetical protein